MVKSMKIKFLTVNRILWLVYLALLVVLLPHTAWAFQIFEPAQDDGGISLVAWTAAFAFEAAIAALTHKLAKQIESTPKRASRWSKFNHRYLNAYSAGLVASVGVSSLANLAHAVEFGSVFDLELEIFATWGIPFGLYALAFGAILPMISLVFARVLSNVVESEAEDDPAMIAARDEIAKLRQRLREAERERDQERTSREQAEARFAALGDIFVGLMSEEKKERILAARTWRPQLPNAAIAIIADASPAYVSEVLAELPANMRMGVEIEE